MRKNKKLPCYQGGLSRLLESYCITPQVAKIPIQNESFTLAYFLRRGAPPLLDSLFSSLVTLRILNTWKIVKENELIENADTPENDDLD